MTAFDDARALGVLALRRQGQSLRQIAAQYHVSRERARQLCMAGEQVEEQRRTSVDIWWELSAATRNALRRDGCDPRIDAVVEYYSSLTVLKRVPALGRKRITELQAWLVRHGKEPIP